MVTKPRRKNAAAQALGRLGGRAGSPAQTAARRVNAQLGGRPRRVCLFCNEPVVGGHVARHLDLSCGAHGWRWQNQAEQAAPIDVRALLVEARAELEQLEPTDARAEWIRQAGVILGG